jgi:hypothetical protein
MGHIEHAVDRLIELGYLKYVAPAEKPSIREELIDALRRGYLDSAWDKNCVSRDRRSYFADSEDLAEGCLGKCLLAMEGVLQREGVQLLAVEDGVQDWSYDVIVNGHRHCIYDDEIMEHGNTWGVSTKRFLEIVNGLLEEAGSKERLYAIYGGNEGRVILLTEEMYQFLHSPDLNIDAKWMPYPSTAIRDDGGMDR